MSHGPSDDDNRKQVLKKEYTPRIYSALTDTTVHSSAFHPLSRWNHLLSRWASGICRGISYVLISNYHRVIDISINTSIGPSCTWRLSDIPNGDSRGRTAGCSLMSMPRTRLLRQMSFLPLPPAYIIIVAGTGLTRTVSTHVHEYILYNLQLTPRWVENCSMYALSACMKTLL